MHRIKHHIHRHVGIHHISTWKSFILVFSIITLGLFGVNYSLRAYGDIFKSEINIVNAEDVGAKDSVLITFSIPMKTPFENVKIFPSQEVKIQWNDSNKNLLISPKDVWKPETQYRIILPKVRNAMFSENKQQELVFSTKPYPKPMEVVPENGAQNVVIDIEDPIIINFEKSTEDFFLKFELNPKSDLSIQNNVNKTQFKLLPEGNIDGGTEYILKVYAKFAEDPADDFKPVYASSFKTEIPPKITWESDYNLRLTQAKKYTQAKKNSGKYIDINLETQVMTLFEDGRLLDSYMISSGKKGMGTPIGEAKIYNKFPRAYSRAYGLYMPFWMAISPTGKFGIHELPEWPNGYKEGAAHLGIPVSHGCVRLGVGSAGRVYSWAEIGTPVIVY